VKAVERAEAKVAHDEIETGRAEPAAGGLELEMMLDLRQRTNGFLDDVGHSRIRFDQEHHVSRHWRWLPLRVDRTAQSPLRHASLARFPTRRFRLTPFAGDAIFDV
jgi:hypothetical protein